MIDNIVLLITGTLHQRPISELVRIISTIVGIKQLLSWIFKRHQSIVETVNSISFGRPIAVYNLLSGVIDVTQVGKCHPLGSFEQMEAIHIARWV